MKIIVLTCCGQKSEPLTGGEFTCPACGTHFTENQLEWLVEQEQASIPVVTLQGAKDMLPMLSQETILQEGRGFGAREEPGFGLIFPIACLRDFASQRNLEITPRPLNNGVFWINKTQDLS